MTINQQPASLSFVGNLPDFLINTEEAAVSFIMTLGGDTIIDEEYIPDNDGNVRIPVKFLIEEYLSIAIPDTDLFLQEEGAKEFVATIDDGLAAPEVITFTVIKGGVNRKNLDTVSFFNTNLLTWQPQTKIVKWNDFNFLSYYATEACTVRITAYFEGGTSETSDLHSLAAAGLYSFRTTFSHIRADYTAQPIFFDIWVESVAVVSGEPVFRSFPQRYVLTDEEFDFDDHFVFENSLGGIDSIRFTGEKKLVNANKFDLGLYFDEITEEYQVNPDKAFEKNTGYFRSKIELNFSQDFFSSKQKYLQEESDLVRILTRDPEVSDIKSQLVAFDFVYIFTEQTKYIDGYKSADLANLLVIIGPDDVQYFLVPRLYTFPEIDDPTKAIFPVQKEGEDGWKYLTYADLLAALAEDLGGGSESIPTLQEVTDQGNSTTNKISHADGVDPTDSATVGQLNQAIEDLNYSLPDGLISGGVVQWSGVDYDFFVSAALIRENGILINIPADTFTINPGDADDPRKDTVVVSSAGFEVLEGTPASDPVEPQPTGVQIRLTVIDVLALSTEPDAVSLISVYKENLEYTVSHVGAGSSNPDDLSTPYEGIKAVNVSSVQNGSTTVFTAPANIDFDSIDSFTLRLRLKQSFSSGHNLSAFLLDASDNEVGRLLIPGLIKGLTSGYQFLAFAMSSFVKTGTEFRKIAIRFVRTGNSTTRTGYFIDNFILQGGLTQPPITASPDHNDLVGLQGGQAGQYFHLKSAQHAAIEAANAPSGTNPVATMADLPALSIEAKINSFSLTITDDENGLVTANWTNDVGVTFDEVAEAIVFAGAPTAGNFRWDLIKLNYDGTISVISGTAANPPVRPSEGAAGLIAADIIWDENGAFEVVLPDETFPDDRFATAITFDNLDNFAKVWQGALFPGQMYSIILAYTGYSSDWISTGKGRTGLVNFTWLSDGGSAIDAASVKVETFDGNSQSGDWTLVDNGDGTASIWHRSRAFWGRTQFRVLFFNDIVRKQDFINNAPYVSAIPANDGEYASLKYGAEQLDELLDVILTLPVNDSFLQRKAGVWVNRTLAQVRADLGLSDDYIASTGTILFDQPRKYGYNGSPVTGNLTIGITDAKEINMAKVLHDDTVAPTISVPGGVTLHLSGGTYDVAKVNEYLFICHKNNAGTVTRISYTISPNLL